MEANLNVARILVGLVHGNLQFLLQPVFHLVSIPRELLQRLCLPQLGAVVNQCFLQPGPPTASQTLRPERGVNHCHIYPNSRTTSHFSVMKGYE